jgi:hypothetical protein
VSQEQGGGGKTVSGVPDDKVQTAADNARVNAEETSRLNAVSQEQGGDGKTVSGVPNDKVQTAADNARVNAEETSRLNAVSQEQGGGGKYLTNDKVQTAADNARINAEETSRLNAVSQEQGGGGKTVSGVPNDKVQTAADNARVNAEETSRVNAVSQEQGGGGKTVSGVPDDKVQTAADNARVNAEETSRVNAVSQEQGGDGKTVSGVPDDKVQTAADNARINTEEMSRYNADADNKRTLIGRPNSGVDTSALHIAALTENNLDPYERTADGKFNIDFPQTIDSPITRYTQVFGHIISLPFRAFNRGLNTVNNGVGALVDGVNRTVTTAASAAARGLGASLETQESAAQIAAGSMRGLGTALGSIGDGMDVLGIVQTFGDSMFYTKYNGDDSRFLNGQVLRDNLVFSIEQQVAAIELYNAKIDNKNNSSTPPSEPYAKIKYPLISGPLDLVDTVNHSPFYAQIRVEAEIDSVRERLLRTDTVHKQNFITMTSQSFYDSKFRDPTKNLTSYVNANFGGIQNDDLYRDAFTRVCTYYKGVVFEDKYPADDTTGRGGRSRFQCGWGTPEDCETHARQWFDSIYTTKKDPPGNYAEWFKFDEFSTIKKQDGTQVVANPVFEGNPTAACIVTNSGIRSMCRKYNGTYANHTCEYTVQYCQSIGTCFDKSTKSCYLPPDTMAALAIGFGTGGVREFIKINGCKFESGMSSDPNRTALQNVSQTVYIQAANGSKFVQDLIANQPQWNEGFRQVLKDPANSLNFASSALGVASFMGSNKFPKFAASLGALSLLVGAAGAITGVINTIRDSGELRMKPTVDKQEYTTGGWNIGGPTDSKGYLPKGVTFLNGWVTRPLKYHPVGQPNNPYGKIDDFPGMKAIDMFDRSYFTTNECVDSSPDVPRAGSIKAVLGTQNITQRTCWEDGQKYQLVRGGGDACSNRVLCIPPFPGETLKVDAIGPLAAGSTKWLTNNVWTSGEFPGYPMFPSNPYTNNGRGGSDNVFYYQLVYDKDNIDQNTMWNNETLMRQYFSEAMINNMRWYYCSKFIKSCPSGTCPGPGGATINPKCYGYLTLETSLYKSLRMTVPGR